MRNRNERWPRKTKLDIAIDVSLYWWIFVGIASTYLFFTSPRTPVPAAGRIYPLQIKGVLVYLTKGEYAIAGFVLYYYLIALLLFAIKFRRHLRGSE